MKTNKWMVFLFLLVFCRCANEINETQEKECECETIQYDEWTTISTCGTTTCFPAVSDKYKYPIVLGSEEWKQIKTSDEAYQVCQLPADILKSISTPGLIDALIHAPMFIGFFYHSAGYATVWNGYYETFNSSVELFKRKDAGKALVAYYKLINLNSLSALNCEDWSSRLCGLECLFTREEILDTMDHEKKKEAVAAFLENVKIHSVYDHIYPMAHIMFADQYEPVVKYLQENNNEYVHIFWTGSSCPLKSELCAKIVTFAKDFINDKK